MTRHILRPLGLVLLVASVQAAPALAQDAPSRPFRGLFGGNERNPGSTQVLDFTTDIQGGHDSDVLALDDLPLAIDPRYQVGGDYALSTVALTYSTALAGRVLTISGRAASNVKYAPPALPLGAPQHEGALAVGLAKTLGVFSFNARQAATYTPYRRLAPFPMLPQLNAAPVTAAGHDFAVSTDHVFGLNSDADVRIAMGRRSAFSAIYRRLMTDYSSQPARMVDQSVGGLFTNRLTEHASLRLGYTYRMASYSGIRGAAPVPSHHFDTGIDYNRPLSISRKTTLGFSSGSSAASDGFRTYYYATGSASLNHEIGRSWGARLSFNRALTYLDGVAMPFIANGVSADTSGYLGRRVDVVINAGYSDGIDGLSAVRSQYTTYTGSSRVRFAFSRYGSLYAQYFYYQHQLRHFGQALPGVPPRMERRGVRAGLTLWLPLLR